MGGLQYTGELDARGRRHGRGGIVYEDNSEYRGGWRDDDYHGRGTFVDIFGGLYDSEWERGRKHGAGVTYWKGGEVDVEEYEDDRSSGQGVRWIEGRKTAWLLEGGMKGREIGLAESKEVASRLGFPAVPM